MIVMPSPLGRFLAIALIACSAGFMPVLADISLSGEQDGFLETGHYLVTASITVKRGKTLSFAPGSIVRFKRFAGILVEGTLTCTGNAGLPILFTSENHRVSGPSPADAPAPFDWNGILVVDSLASLDLECVHVIYSTFGLDIKSPRSSVRLKDAVFDENGQFNLRVGGAQIDIKDGEQFSFSQPQRVESPKVEPAEIERQPEPLLPPSPAVPETGAGKKTAQKGAWKLPVRIGCGAVALLGVGAAFFFDAELVKNQDKYDHVAELKDQALIPSYKKKRDEAEKNRNFSKVIALIGAGGFSITFLF